MCGSWGNMWGGGFGFSWVFMLLFWGLIIAGVVIAIKWFMDQSRGTQGQERTPLDILKERYAKGEINKEEFESKKKDLG